MRLLLIAVLLNSGQITIPKSSPTVLPSTAQKQPATMVPQIDRYHLNTTPDLDQDTQEIHAQMERDIGGQGEAISGLKYRLTALEDLRVNIDRKDIDDLKEFHSHFVWTCAIISTILGTMVALFLRFHRIIWEDSILPRLRRVLLP